MHAQEETDQTDQLPYEHKDFEGKKDMGNSVAAEAAVGELCDSRETTPLSPPEPHIVIRT